jgi:hypothetical protein
MSASGVMPTCSDASAPPLRLAAEIGQERKLVAHLQISSKRPINSEYSTHVRGQSPDARSKSNSGDQAIRDRLSRAIAVNVTSRKAANMPHSIRNAQSTPVSEIGRWEKVPAICVHQ